MDKRLKNLYWLIGTEAAVLCPLLLARFVPATWGMLATFLLFFAIVPLYAVICGVFAGLDGKSAWFRPLITALTYLAGAWIFLDIGELAFLYYAGIYLVLGYAAMGVTALILRSKAAK